MRPVLGWLRWMPDSITIEPYTGKDSYGKPTFGTAVSYRCRIVSRIRQVRTWDQRELTSMHTVYLASGATIHPMSRATLPSRFVPSQAPIVAVGQHTDDQGPHSTILYF